MALFNGLLVTKLNILDGQCLSNNLPHIRGASKKIPKLTRTLVIFDNFSQKKGRNGSFNGLLVAKLKIIEGQCFTSNLPHM